MTRIDWPEILAAVREVLADLRGEQFKASNVLARTTTPPRRRPEWEKYRTIPARHVYEALDRLEADGVIRRAKTLDGRRMKPRLYVLDRSRLETGDAS